jgi:hypothetical protein
MAIRSPWSSIAVDTEFLTGSKFTWLKLNAFAIVAQATITYDYEDAKQNVA